MRKRTKKLSLQTETLAHLSQRGPRIAAASEVGCTSDWFSCLGFTCTTNWDYDTCRC